jgi:hypothetical protein
MMTLEENVAQLRDALTVNTTLALRHEKRLKEHQQWLEDNELAYNSMRITLAETSLKIKELAAAQVVTEKMLQGLIESLQKGGGNGHNG